MELRQLKYFAAVARTLNFTEAARQLYITQGTLSQQLRQLEFELGSDLFVRSSHSVVLTEAGEVLLPLATEMLETSELCQSRMKDLRKIVSGELRIGVSASLRHMTSIVARQFMSKYPGVTLHIYSKGAVDLIQMLRNKELDLAVTLRQHCPDPDLYTKELFVTYLSAVVCKNHFLADRESIHISDLERFGLILPGGGLVARESFEDFFCISLGKIKPIASVESVDVILDLIRGTDKVALLSSIEVADKPDFVAVPIEIEGEGRREMVCCAQRLTSTYRKRSTLAFVDLLSQQADLERICMNL